MLREQAQLFKRFLMLADLIFVGLSLILAYFSGQLWGNEFASFRSYAWILLFACPVWLFFLNAHQLHDSIRRLGFLDIAVKLFNTQIRAGFITGCLIWIIDKDDFSRSVFLSFIVTSYFLLLSEKFSIRLILGFIRRKGFNYRNILIVGTKDKALKFNNLVELHKDWGLRVIGFLQAIKETPLQETIHGHKVLGYIDSLVEVCKSLPVDEVVFCLPKKIFVNAEDYLHDLQELGITVRMVLDFYDMRHSRRVLHIFHDDLPILTFHSKSLDAQQLMLKRLLDIFGAILGLITTAILFPIIALAIKKDSPGPVFFFQERVGENGRKFKCCKFRSMHTDAEERKKELMPSNEMNGFIFKIKEDPRITEVGRFLRNTSLDELPQFWNVLKGEMSLVGTRPPTPEEVENYENWHRRRISIKPGMTGLWQVSGRSNISNFDEIVRLDITYIENWSLWLDLSILVRTLKVVITHEGSC